MACVLPQLLFGTEPDDRTVVLIHGLDDPGKVWMNLGPALARRNFSVWTMRYPNDQPIDKSAELLSAELKKLARAAPGRAVALVAHSMGGLVSRACIEDGAGRIRRDRCGAQSRK